MTDTIIEVENLGKRYVLDHQQEREKYTALRDVIAQGVKSALKGFSRQKTATKEEFWALKDVSFEVKRGEVVGIIGRNGAGKSTLLKILSRITEPTTGRVRLKGRVASLLEVGTGFHPELTGRENIYLNGAVLGMMRQEIDRKFDEIVAFAEVEKFLDTPVKRYSSGMYVRLAFAVAAHLEPEILVVDEVLAVGDAAFQKKCLGKMGDVASKEGRTVLFVSHNMGAIRGLCNRSLLLSQGKLKFYTDVETAVNHYLSEEQTLDAYIEWNENNTPQSSEIKFIRAYILNRDQEIVSRIDCRHSFSIIIEYEVLTNLTGLRIGFSLQNSEGIVMCGSNDPEAWNEQNRKVGYYTSRCDFPEYILNNGLYSVCFGADKYPYERALVSTSYCLNFMIEDTEGHGTMKEKLPGVIRPKLKWKIHTCIK
ncbi:MAG: ABC transporter ATP-binding protein [Microcystis viridis Mv_BB_P_19951000_S69]|uniref:ABC transporter ATP-binding protein n=1 Tax=Microcystis viridis Mv_BB_P_19951000_S68D TaxID=2486270 RepID=A0A552I8Q0_MICVR|nr:MAG: ABC transporter ATP-binding protein [Microcystis viridis Mv_BB_P_19951000_S69]TRU79245.1 MAG: ABC transporter ATP-binding protein [Microcystis viridis Mv_BB_P_19951000_S68]TRU79821.1 MAG: ABC transporter ATP-binding protein [Microcystis viridis Mv_BB_P_19951000_S68D]TRU90414.1 MAG: ABC transporter ATP-binding protein [Microcystis viridis Mv_BB_P_19951000_S69D]